MNSPDPAAAVASASDGSAVWRAEYPFRSHFWEVAPGIRMHYVDEGPAQTSLGPVLAVHGNPTWSFYYRHLVQHFAQPTSTKVQPRRVVAVDHVGCGLSDKPQDYPYCLAQHRDNLVRLIEHLDLRNITLVAHDWGGPIGLTTLQQVPDRFSRIVLLNTGAFPPPYVPLRIAACRIPVLGTVGMRGFNLFSRAAITMAVSRKSLSPAAAAGLLAPYDSWANRVAVDRFVKDIPRSPEHPTWQVLQTLEQKLPAFRHLPALFVWGMQDWCFRPDCLRRLQQLLPEARALEIQDAGHYVMEDATAEVLSAIEQFLQS